ncbi:hypothetical protein BCR33DRAFT_768996 [Rhizoclosmatium globosum]|uniref:HTH CENPB-type domain-containing protein n=1 Tax=Rhizoclosmatium globosum TaxID=329046 RepID=A0A1Y2BVV0_9FUNG|nr:hypothetical protein BCR33DRAFT_768996 [Rhizoclosmatium globosum]|eukprot:ORY38863.1 hypothetical protein BCR33DRAFT_768996 [Rhizoclosmatium globosum]
MDFLIRCCLIGLLYQSAQVWDYKATVVFFEYQLELALHQNTASTTSVHYELPSIGLYIQRHKEEDNVALLRLLGGIPYDPNDDHDYVPSESEEEEEAAANFLAQPSSDEENTENSFTTKRSTSFKESYHALIRHNTCTGNQTVSNAFCQSYGANHKKACHWFKDCEGTFDRGSLHVSSYTDGGRVQVQRKARRGRGRKVSPWVSAIHLELKDEFERLRKAGVKFDLNLLRTLAMSLVSRGLEYGPDYEMLLGKDSVDIDGKKHIDKLTYLWIQNFMERNNIVTRRQTGKLSVSPEKQEAIEQSVAYHMGQLKRDFENGTSHWMRICFDISPQIQLICASQQIQKVKECWTKIWNKEKLRMLENEDVSEASGKLKNPGKHFFLRTASQSVKDANSQKDSDGLSYTRKAMIRCGLSLENGEWKESMLSKQLQDIMNKYRENFDGTQVDEVVKSEQECSSGSE